jgi:HSP20 family protein
MALIRWIDRPEASRFGEEMERMQRDMNRLFSGFMGRGVSPFRGDVFPAVNVSEDADALYVRAELPGMLPEEIDISVEGDTVTLRGERKLKAAEHVNYHRRERESGRFRRIFTLPTRVNPEAVSASFKDGVLKITLPKAEEVKPKQIHIKSE